MARFAFSPRLINNSPVAIAAPKETSMATQKKASAHTSTNPPVIHLVCNAHLDPVWQWSWEEGAAEALATFRIAADFCEEFQGFIFNHNEVLLYEWVERFDPALFERIRKLVRQGQWHIMGGWFLQPDCNLPSGESFVRQISYGRRYFHEKFGVTPRTAINFDPFGHTRGLVQIMAQTGFTSYLFCRPGDNECSLPAEDFIWEGFSGAELVGSRAFDFYLAHRGKARDKVERWIEQRAADQPGLILWGVGNHGGGPSRVDLEQLGELMTERQDFRIVHSTPEAYFAALEAQRPCLPRFAGDLFPSNVGCYTSQIRIKQRHRKLENEYFSTEKLCSYAALQGLLTYPANELRGGLRDLLFSQFHDILPGSSVQPVEAEALRLMDHGLETLSRLKAEAFFAMARGPEQVRSDQIPVLIYNPHPYPVEGIWECEMQLADQHHGSDFILPTILKNGKPIASQCEKENSNIGINWRKRVVFAATLQPSAMNRFTCQPVTVPEKPKPMLAVQKKTIRFKNDALDVVIDATTGLLRRYRVAGIDYLSPQACAARVMLDNADPWGMTVRGFKQEAGRFKLMTPAQAHRFCALPARAPFAPVRVVEDGAVRSVIEALFTYGTSALVMRYKLPKQGTELELEIRVFWNEKDRMLKLELPAAFSCDEFIGQTAYGISPLPMSGDEGVAQKWIAAVQRSQDRALTIINDGIYGFSAEKRAVSLSLLRSPAYCAHPIDDRPLLVQDRFIPRIDQGEHLFHFWLNAGPARDRLERIDREALARNEAPPVLAMFPAPAAQASGTVLLLSDRVVQVNAVKFSEDGKALVVRLFEPTGRARQTWLELPGCALRERVSLKGFEIKTLRIDLKSKTCHASGLLEQNPNNGERTI
jgi:alpha-mannosidase